MEQQRVFKLVLTENWDKNAPLHPLFPERRVAPEEHIVCTVGMVSEDVLRNWEGVTVGGYKEFECKYLTEEQIVEAVREMLPAALAELREWEEKHG